MQKIDGRFAFNIDVWGITIDVHVHLKLRGNKYSA